MPNGKEWPRRVAISSIVIAAILICCCIIIFFLRGTTVVLLVRHAERSDTQTCTPATVKTRPNLSLVTAGTQRAQTLAHVGGADSIAAIYASEFCRTQNTVQPLATQLGQTVNVVDQFEADGTTGNVDNLVSQIQANNRGQVVLVAGHTSTVPMIIEELSGVTIDPIPENEFDNLYVVIIPRWWGRPKVVRLKYGVATP